MTPTLTYADDYSPRCGQMPARGLCSVPLQESFRRNPFLLALQGVLGYNEKNVFSERIR
jgi:hypothetical protein